MPKASELSRAELLAQLEKQKREILHKASVVITSIDDQFEVDRSSNIDAAFTQQTVGLVTQTEYQQARDNMDLLARQQEDAKARQRAEEMAKKQQEVAKRKKLLSIANDDEEEEEEVLPVVKRAKKNPDADTSFLRDEEREAEEKAMREQLTREFEAQQQRERQEVIKVEFSFYDGSSYRKSMKLEKGSTIGQFLERARKELAFVFRKTFFFKKSLVSLVVIFWMPVEALPSSKACQLIR